MAQMSIAAQRRDSEAGRTNLVFTALWTYNDASMASDLIEIAEAQLDGISMMARDEAASEVTDIA